MSAQSNDKGVCKFAVTPPQPLFLEGSFKSRYQRHLNLTITFLKLCDLSVLCGELICCKLQKLVDKNNGQCTLRKSAEKPSLYYLATN